jgi:ligand-binding sensor domain-containing protein/signal transduction histidine kinase
MDFMRKQQVNFSFTKWIKLILTTCFLAFVFTAYTQSSVKFTHITNVDGLSQSTVQAIVKDHYGFMWFGTQDGLNRYDGYNFKVYRHIPKDSNSLRRSHIMTLYEDRQGNLWIGTNNGALSMYERQHDHFIHYYETKDGKPGLSQKTVTAIYEDKQNNFWVGTYWRLNLLDRKTGKIEQFASDQNDPNSISSDGITCIFEDSHNNLWIGTTIGLNLMDRQTKKFKRFFHSNDAGSLSDNAITSIHEDSKGRLWIGTSNGLNLMNVAAGKFTRFQTNPADPTSLFNNQIGEMADADNGNLWIGTRNSLELLDVTTKTFVHNVSHVNIENTLNKSASITSLYKDPQGILWAGTYNGGVNKYDPHLTSFDLYRNNPYDLNSLGFNVITSFAEETDRSVWIATAGGGLNHWQRSTNTFIRYNPDPANKNSLSNFGVLCLYRSKKSNYLWIGTYGSCIDRFDVATKTFKHYTKGDKKYQLNNDAVYAVYEDSRGYVWIATNGGGVNVLDQSTGIITKYKNDPNDPYSIGGDYVRCFFEDRKGNIWVGSSGGISVFDPSTKKFTNYNQNTIDLESDIIHSIYEDNKGNMWIGSLGGGLLKLNPQTKKLVYYTTNEGLPDNTINGIAEDDKGYLWLSTNNGISRFDPSKVTFKNMNLDNDLQGFEFSLGACLKIKSGEILFGGVNGFNVLHPNNVIKNEIAPPVVISDFKIFNKSVLARQEDSPLQEDIAGTKEITLSYNQSIISFDFAALNYTAPKKNQYAYMLEGFDKSWIYCGNNRTATYTNLDPGKYIFHVKASNNDGVWNDRGTSIKIVITPPFWQTWWFKLLAVVAAFASAYLVYKMRVRTINQQKHQLEKQVQERTQSLAQMTLEERKAKQEANEANKELERKNKELEQFAYVASHDLQEPLRTISSFLDLMHNQYKDNFDDKASKYMSFIMQASDRMKVLINDLLEYSRIGKKKETACVDLNQTVKAVLADLHKAITDAGAEIIVGELPVVSAYPTEMKQIFQNLIINAIKFRKKETTPIIEIAAEKKDDRWHFFVKDNGIGIDPKQSERIFVIFQRLHSRSEYEGSGIGLSHCKKIAELHKGKIWVESTLGEGSCFCFTIKDLGEVHSETQVEIVQELN